jgi:hypothetical protein
MEATGLDPKTLVGEYWTDRLTRGSYRMHLMTSKCFGDFASAKSFEEGGH